MKLAWNLKPDSQKLWSQVLVCKYGRGVFENGELQLKSTDSFIWKALCACWINLKDGEA